MEVIAISIIFAIIGYFLAKRKNRNIVLWTVLSFLFTVLSIIVLFFLPKIINPKNERKSIGENLRKKFKYSRPSKVVGVTFKNDDGSDRQSNIKKYVKEGNELFLKAYEYKKGKYAVAVLAKENNMKTQIGNLNESFCDDFVNADPSTEFEVTVLNITGGTKDKPTLGVNFELSSTKEI